MPDPLLPASAARAAAVIQPLSESTLRELVVERAQELAAAGIREKHGPNRGEPFDTYNRSAGVAAGSPYCVSLWHYELGRLFGELGLKMPLRIGASTSLLAKAAGRVGRLRTVAEARPGDLLLFRRSNGAYFHTGLLLAVLSGGRLRTVEGNTAPARRVVGEGDGIYQRERVASPKRIVAVDLCSSPRVLQVLKPPTL